ncbi:MAG TPA: toll/interleukin-1 receptor domain-containing protein [Thermoanaerobaculia bacterium]|nr:toll/interleukin-1 receptor domain-containing protein [Thermoanaerobaculia bacterium]
MPDPRYAHCSLEEANLERANLRGARLDWTNLGQANLKGANLRAASLNGTYASFARFDEACLANATVANSILHIVNFSGCDLRAANFSDSDLRDADLRNANLSGAQLGSVKFIGTKLDGADMSETTMGRTVFSGVDLSAVRGLESVHHSGPSSVGVDTLYLSRGDIPEVFLRGIGMEEALIEYLPSLLSSSAIEFYSCFISYSHEQSSFAKRLHDQLQMRGIRCWLDAHELLPGDDIYDMVDRGIRLSDKVLLCCSRGSLSSWWVNDEIGKALEKERQLQKERGLKALVVMPLNLDNFILEEWKDGRAATLRRRLAADFVGWESNNSKFEASFERLVQALRTDERC